MADNIETGRVFLPGMRRRPEGETIIARVARGAILDDRVAHADAEVYPVSDGVAEAAALHDEVAGVVDPHAGLGVFTPDARDGGIHAKSSADAVVVFAVIPVIQIADDGEVRKMDVAASTIESDPPVGIRVKIGVPHEGCVPHARALNDHAGRDIDVAGDLESAGTNPNNFALLLRRRDAISQRSGVVGFAFAVRAKVGYEKRIRRRGQWRRDILQVNEVNDAIRGGVIIVLLQAQHVAGDDGQPLQTNLVIEISRLASLRVVGERITTIEP